MRPFGQSSNLPPIPTPPFTTLRILQRPVYSDSSLYRLRFSRCSPGRESGPVAAVSRTSHAGATFGEVTDWGLSGRNGARMGLLSGRRPEERGHYKRSAGGRGRWIESFTPSRALTLPTRLWEGGGSADKLRWEGSQPSRHQAIEAWRRGGVEETMAQALPFDWSCRVSVSRLVAFHESRDQVVR